VSRWARRPTLVETLAAARKDRQEAETERGDLGRELDTLHRERDLLAGRRASLEELVATHGAFDAGVRALLDDRAASGVMGVLADTIEVASEHEKAVEGFLGDALQALVVPNAETARQGVVRLAESAEGRASFLILGRSPGACAPLGTPDDPRILGRLSELYKVSLPGRRIDQAGPLRRSRGEKPRTRPGHLRNHRRPHREPRRRSGRARRVGGRWTRRDAASSPRVAK
jgi:hypothetical protein